MNLIINHLYLVIRSCKWFCTIVYYHVHVRELDIDLFVHRHTIISGHLSVTVSFAVTGFNVNETFYHFYLFYVGNLFFILCISTAAGVCSQCRCTRYTLSHLQCTNARVNHDALRNVVFLGIYGDFK